MPVGEASLMLERLTGINVPRATLSIRKRRQGTRARSARARSSSEVASLALATSAGGRKVIQASTSFTSPSRCAMR